MEMNRINGPGITGIPAAVPPADDQPNVAADKQKPGPSGDRIEFSDQGKGLTAGGDGIGASREAKIDAARRKLETGALITPTAIENAAERLLRSGDLKDVEET